MKIEISKITEEQLRTRAKIAEIDAELNGGALIEVARVYGKPLYSRLDQHDPEKAKRELAELEAIVKSVAFWG